MSPSFLDRRGVRVAVASLGAIACAALFVAAAVGPDQARGAPQDTQPVDWAVVLVGPPHGTMEPCGCAGGMLGGIDRLGSAVRMHRQTRGAPSIAVAAGGFLSREAVASGVEAWQQSQIEALWFALGSMQLDAIGLSAQEIGLSRRALDQARAYLGAVPILATNLFDSDGGSPFDAVHTDAKSGVAVLCFLAEGLANEGEPAWSTVPVADALARLERRGVALGTPGKRFVLVEGDEARARDVAKVFAAGDVVAWYGGRGDASGNAVSLRDSAAAPVGGFAGERLRHVVVVRARGGDRRWESHPVDQFLPSDPTLVEAQAMYREWLAERDVIGAYAGNAGPHPRGEFAGSQSCQACHAEAFDAWRESGHSHALATLERDLRGAWPATVDPACVKCHTVGFGSSTGFGVRTDRGRDAAAILGAVGCESCHGPGATHVRTGAARDIVRSNAATCMTCHDAENDPSFDFGRKWPLILHGAR